MYLLGASSAPGELGLQTPCLIELLSNGERMTVNKWPNKITCSGKCAEGKCSESELERRESTVSDGVIPEGLTKEVTREQKPGRTKQPLGHCGTDKTAAVTFAA